MQNLISDHMLVVFFIYGLAFFLLGIAILLQPRRGSAFNIGNSLWLLAGFGLLHGMGEWMDMFLTLGETYWTPHGTQVIKIASLYFGAASFVFLLQFGLRIILQSRSRYKFLERTVLITSSLFLVAVSLYGISTGFSGQWLLLSQILMRYLLGFPGATLVAIGFWEQKKLFRAQALSLHRVDRSLMLMAAAFALYAVLAGLVVPKGSFFPASVLNYATFIDAIKIPVQIFRAACALLAAYSISGILNIFDRESKSRLEKINTELSQTNEQLETRVRERTLKLTKANEALLADVTEREQLEKSLRQERIFLQTPIDHLPDSVYVKDMACRKVIANLAEVRFSGLQTEAEVLGKDDFAIHSKELAEKFFADDQVVLQTGQPVINREEYVLDKQGQKKWLLTTKIPMHDENRQIVGLIGLGRDVTERKRIEEELKTNEMQMSDAQGIAHLGSWDHDAVTGEVKWSDELWRIFGLDRLESGLSFEEYLAMVHPDDRHRVRSINERSQQRKEDFGYDYRVVHVDGTVRVLRASGTVICDEPGQVVKI